MADYDLGNARGTVEIDYDDRGIKEAEKSFQKLEQISARLDKALSGTRRAAVNFGRAFRDMNGGLGPMINNLNTGRTAFNSFASAATRAQRHGTLFAREISRYSNSIMLVRTLGQAFLGWGPDMSKLSPLTQKIIALYSAIKLFRSAQGVVVDLASRLGLLGVAGAKVGQLVRYVGQISGLTAMFGAVGAAAGTLGRKLGLLGGTVFAVGKSLPIVGGLFRGMGTAATAAGVGITGLMAKMTHFKGTTAVVTKALSQTLGVTERVGRAVTRTAFFVLNAKTAWAGFQKLMRLVAKTVAVGAAGITAGLGVFKGAGILIMGTVDALKQMVGVTGLIPAAISMAGAAFLTLKIGLKGFGEALKTVVGDQAAFDEAIKDLAPSAQESLKAIRGFKDELKDLQLDAQGALFEGLGEQIKQVGGPVMDVLKNGTKGVAQAFNRVGKSVISFMGQASTTNALSSIFRDTGSAVTNLGRAVSPLLSAFRDISTVGSRMFAEMTQGAGRAAERFAAFINTAKNNGSMKEWIGQGLQGFKDLWATIKNFGSLIKSVFAHFGIGGDGALAKLRELTETMLALFDASGLAGDDIEKFVAALEEISGKYLQLVGDIFEKLGTQAAKVIPFLKEVALQLDDGIRTAVAILMPFISGLASLVSGPLQGAFAGFAAKAITAVILLKAIKMVGNAFAPIIAGASAASTALTSTGRAAWTGINAFRNIGTGARVAGVQLGRFGTGIDRIGRFVPVIGTMQNAFMKSLVGTTAAGSGLSLYARAAALASTASAKLGAVMTVVNAKVLSAGAVFATVGPRIAASFTTATGAVRAFGASITTMAAYLQAANPAMSRLQANLLALRAAAGYTAGSMRLLAASMMGTLASGAARAGTAIKGVTIQMVALTRASGAAAIAGLRVMASTLLSLVGGPLIAGLIAVGVAIYSIVQAAGAAAKQTSALNKAGTDAAQGMRALVDVFDDANGVLTDDVFTAVTNNLETMRKGLDDVGKTGTGFFADTGALLLDFADDVGNLVTEWSELGNSENMAMNDSLDEVADKAKAAGRAFDTLGASAQEMGEAVTQQGAYDVMREKLLAIADGGKEAAAALEDQRNKFIEVERSLANIGEPALTLSNALAVIGDEAASASEKLDAMKSALQAMGILETSVQEAMFGVTEALKDVSGEAAAVFNLETDGRFFNDLGTGFDTTSTNAIKLHDEMKTMGDSLMAVASAGGNVGEAWAQMQPKMAALEAATGLSNEQLMILGRTVGLVPTELDLFVRMNGSSEAQQELFAFKTKLEEVGADKEFVIKARTQEALGALTSLGIQFDVLNATTGEVKVKPIGQEQVLQVLAMMTNAKNVLTAPGSIPIGTTGAPAAIGELNATGDAAEGATGSPVVVPISVTGDADALGKIQGVTQAAAQPIPDLKINVQAEGIESATTGIQGVQGVVGDANVAFQDFATGVQTSVSNAGTAVDTAAGQIAGTLSGAAGGAGASGAALGQGFADGINSKVGEVAAAAAALAAAASAPLPNSPAKTGPFSGKGWTPFRGIALAEGFAEGIEAGAPLAANASLGMVGQVSAAIDSLNAMFGQVQSSYNANTDVSSTKFIRNEKTNEELRAENAQKVADRIKADERSALQKAQNEAKDAVKAAAEPAKEEKEKSAETAQKDAAKEAEDAADARYKRAMQVLEEGVSSDAEVADSVNALREKGTIDNDDLANAIAVAGRENSSDADVIRALQQIEAAQTRIADVDTQDELAGLEDAIKSRRGIEEYDPFANASDDIVGDATKIGQSIFGIFDQVKQGLTSAKDLATLLIRGMSSTNDITSAIDGFQDVANGIGSIISTVGDVAGTIGSIAASFGQMIPGLGTLISGVGLITGGLSQANAIIDLVQTGFDFLGGIAGNVLSRLAGGKDGALMGNVKTLIDTNDKTIKRWSENDPGDKRSSSYGNAGPAKNTAVENLNIYQGPGQDPYKMVETGMFAVKTYAAGVYN